MTTNRARRRRKHQERLQRPPHYARLRVMAEYSSSGIWVMEQVGPFRHWGISHSDLRLPEELAQRFARWIAWYEEQIKEYEQQPPYQLDHVLFNQEGRSVAQALKAFVGPTTYVEFQPETEKGGLNPPEEIT